VTTTKNEDPTLSKVNQFKLRETLQKRPNLRIKTCKVIFKEVIRFKEEIIQQNNPNSQKIKKNELKLKRIITRNELAKLSEESQIKSVLDQLYVSNKTKENKINNRILRILKNPELLMFSFHNLSKNKGALTIGTGRGTADNIDTNVFKRMSNQIEHNEYTWSDIRRVNIPKPGKKKLRPLGIPNFEDRIVQEGIRIILNSIYEPIFQKLETNFGFRPKRSTTQAISKINTESISATTAIEGDIKKAFDEVHHPTLIKILEKKIDDKRFLSFLYKGLKANILEEGRITHSLTGVPQGGIASPILFNIYMHEFDKAVLSIVSEFLKKKNTDEKRKPNYESKIYHRTNSVINRIRTKLRALKNYRTDKAITPSNKEKETKWIEHLMLRNRLRKLLTLRSSTKSIAQNGNWLTFSYTRYADDWIILTNADTNTCAEIKDLLSDWLSENLKLELSPEKTLVTDLRKNRAKFLGFTFITDVKKRQYSEWYIKRTSLGPVKTRHRVNLGPVISIDHDRVKNRFRTEGIIDRKDFPIGVAKYTALTPFQIVTKYKQKIQGLVNYYFHNITFKSHLNQYYYYYRYSCAKTLARREKISMSQVFKKNGLALTITIREQELDQQNNKTYKEKIVSFPGWQDLMKHSMELNRERNNLEHIYKTKREEKISKETGQKIKLGYKINEVYYNAGLLYTLDENTNIETTTQRNDPFEDNIINLRTAYKFKKYCCICGRTGTENNPLQAHHIRHIRKGKVIGFSEILKSLNRKQIIVCRSCHVKIHNGQYDGIALSELYDQSIAEL
jgi:group II intron reverse transcriptase/maturase